MALCMFIRTLVQSGICISPNVASTICSAHCVRTCAFYLFCLLWSCHDILMECTHSAMCHRSAMFWIMWINDPCGSRRLSLLVYAVSDYHTPSLVGHKPTSWYYCNSVVSTGYTNQFINSADYWYLPSYLLQQLDSFDLQSYCAETIPLAVIITTVRDSLWENNCRALQYSSSLRSVTTNSQYH